MFGLLYSKTKEPHKDRCNVVEEREEDIGEVTATRVPETITRTATLAAQHHIRPVLTRCNSGEVGGNIHVHTHACMQSHTY